MTSPTGASDPKETLPNDLRSEWSAVAGPSPVQAPGAVTTFVILTHLPTGKTLTQEVQYDGTLNGLLRRVKATVDGLDEPTGKIAVVPPGTVLDLNDPLPPPPPEADEARDAYFAGKNRVQRLQTLVALQRVGVTQKMLSDAIDAWNALPFVAANEGL